MTVIYWEMGAGSRDVSPFKVEKCPILVAKSYVGERGGSARGPYLLPL